MKLWRLTDLSVGTPVAAEMARSLGGAMDPMRGDASGEGVSKLCWK
jgi:hypothetical protein